MYKYILFFLIIFNHNIVFSMMHEAHQPNVSRLEYRAIILRTFRSVLEHNLQQRSLEFFCAQESLSANPSVSTIAAACELERAYRAEKRIDEALIQLFQTTLGIPYFLLPYWEQIYAFVIEDVDSEEWQRMKFYFLAFQPGEILYATTSATFFEEIHQDILIFLRALALNPIFRRLEYGKNIFNVFKRHEYGARYPFVRVMYLLFLAAEQMPCKQLLRALKDLRISCTLDLQHLQMNGYQTSPLLVFCLQILDKAISLVNYCQDMDSSAKEVVPNIINQQIECTISADYHNPILAAIACTFWLRLQHALCAPVSSIVRD